MLAQSCADWELIVVDDNGVGSLDQKATEKAIIPLFADKRIRYLKHEINKGGCGARNTGISSAKGRFIAFLDDDDEWKPEFLSRISQAFSDNQEAGVVYSSYEVCLDNYETKDYPAVTLHKGNVLSELFRGWCPASTTLVVAKKECFDKAGYFDPSLRSFQDYDMWIRIAHHYHFIAIPDRLVIKHKHSLEQVSTNPDSRLSGLTRIIDKWGEKMTKHHSSKVTETVKAHFLGNIYEDYILRDRFRSPISAMSYLWKGIQVMPPKRRLKLFGKLVMGKNLWSYFSWRYRNARQR